MSERTDEPIDLSITAEQTRLYGETMFSRIRTKADLFAFLGAQIMVLGQSFNAAFSTRITRHDVTSYQLSMASISAAIVVLEGSLLYGTPALKDQLMNALERAIQTRTKVVCDRGDPTPPAEEQSND